jgi:hypothetical protein
MKTTILLTLCVLLSTTASAQIRTLSIEEKPAEIIPYDSLTNINQYNYASQVGQTLYVMPTEKGESSKMLFDTTTEGGSYDSMKGKYFEIVGIRKGPKYEDIDLQLVSKDTRDTIYCSAYMNMDLENFVTVGYFEKLQSRVLGKKFVYVKEGLDQQTWSSPIRDIESRRPRTDIQKGTIFEVVDVVVDEQFSTYDKVSEGSPIILILNNEQYGLAFIAHEEIAKIYADNDVFKNYRNFISYVEQQRNLAMTAERRASLIKKYGTTNGTLISQGKVKLGFTKQMCIDSWGEPSDINKSSGSWGVHEQWVYGSGNYLYFENGVLTSIQN